MLKSCPTATYHFGVSTYFRIVVSTNTNTNTGPLQIFIPTSSGYRFLQANVYGKGRNVVCLNTGQLVPTEQWAIKYYSTGFKWIEKINATAQQPQRYVLKYLAIFKNVAHSLEPGETPRYRKTWWNNHKISIYRNRNATATQPQIMSI